MTAPRNDSGESLACVRCGRPVRVNAEQYTVFERMHWVCFHYEFEHEVDAPDRDPDQTCGDPACPARAFDPTPSPPWDMTLTDPSSVRWADAEIEALEITYDDVLLHVRESTGRKVDVRCLGHIGLLMEGVWDEVIVETAGVVAAHPFMEGCLDSLTERLGGDPPTSGSPARNARKFTTLVVVLIDGARILCAAAAFEVRVRNSR